jgi:hypothetical protein
MCRMFKLEAMACPCGVPVGDGTTIVSPDASINWDHAIWTHNGKPIGCVGAGIDPRMTADGIYAALDLARLPEKTRNAVCDAIAAGAVLDMGFVPEKATFDERTGITTVHRLRALECSLVAPAPTSPIRETD